MSTWPPVTHQDVQDAVAANTTALTTKVGSTTVTTIVTLTAAAYAALGTKDSATLYVVTP